MTKEKLKKEAENWLRKYLLCCNCEKKCNCIDSNSYCEEQVLKAYVDSAEPREKQIQIDAEQIRALQKQNGELADELTLTNNECKDMREELKQRIRENQKLCEQIEKMKNCKNCKKLKKEKDGLLVCTVGSFYTNRFGENCDKWEIKE